MTLVCKALPSTFVPIVEKTKQKTIKFHRPNNTGLKRLFLTCIFASITLTTASVTILRHAGNAAYRIPWSAAVTSPLFIFTAVAAFGDGGTWSVHASVAVITPTIEALEAISVPFISISVPFTSIPIATISAGATSAQKMGEKDSKKYALHDHAKLTLVLCTNKYKKSVYNVYL